jgi:hypothetical protein
MLHQRELSLLNRRYVRTYSCVKEPLKKTPGSPRIIHRPGLRRAHDYILPYHAASTLNDYFVHEFLLVKSVA